jgi:hypothetical protein
MREDTVVRMHGHYTYNHQPNKENSSIIKAPTQQQERALYSVVSTLEYDVDMLGLNRDWFWG